MGDSAEKVYYTNNLVESAGLLISPMDNLMYELNYMAITSYEGSAERAIVAIRESKIPKKDIINRVREVEDDNMLKLMGHPALIIHLDSI